MRIAIVHDWLYTLGGAEKVLAAMLRCFPQADVFCLFDFLSQEDREKIGFKTSRVSFLQRLPGMRRNHRRFLPIMPIAIEQLDLSGYDMIISSSYAVAKGVITGPDQLHVAYVHSPMRYAWDLQHQYLNESGLKSGLKSMVTRLLLHRIRLWDVRTSHGPNDYVANSHFIARRVRKIYGRHAKVIYPPVRVPETYHRVPVGRNFMTASRLVPYKNVRCIVEAFRLLPEERLVVAGSGPEAAALKAIAGPNVTFVGFVPDGELRSMMSRARAFVFAAEEDFGITPVEAQGEGTPVIALGRGGTRETIRTGGDAPTGLFFDEPTGEAVASAIQRFIASEHSFDRQACHANAARFAERIFEDNFRSFVLDRFEAFRRQFAGPIESEVVHAVQWRGAYSELEHQDALQATVRSRPKSA
ncbi:glycosyltransferase [Lichenicoccus roseus]|uniref:Glycosyltransferase family 4 protein n=1 Tax=Lichenicoccus roseus TaxID=2683649 RepID=A0A5R9JAY4_9PROT|nr:glycosyltransferase [Lichenicoccus roseus]TLU72536.1 glycosyltransferase family 4 protein [Lichenicoccus roseus]